MLIVDTANDGQGLQQAHSSSCVINIFDQIDSNFTWFDAPLSDAREVHQCFISAHTLLHFSVHLNKGAVSGAKLKAMFTWIQATVLFCFNATFRSSLQERS